MTTEDRTVTEERHASWAELFFDLVVVAGVGTLAHVVHEDVGGRGLLLYAALFLTFWLSWTTFMLYGNASGAQTRTVRLLAGMFGLAVMAAATPGVAEEVLHHGADGAEGAGITMTNAFAVAYVVTRVIGAGAWRRGAVVVDWPLAQQITGAIPFLVSVWVDEPWKFVLWGLGIAIDLFLLVVVSGDDMMEGAQQRIDAMSRRDPERMSRFDGLVPVRFEAEHLAERLGLFVIIVLGEGVIQSVRAASGAVWDGALLGTGLAAFLLLAGMWGLSVVHGHAGVPHLRPGTVPQRLALALHAGTTASLAAAAAAIGAAVGHGGEPLDEPQRWLLCGAVAVWFTLGLVASLCSRGLHVVQPFFWLVTGVAVPLVIAVRGADLRSSAVLWYLVAVVGAHLLVERRRQRSAAG
ncbi:low temperature requirement protein A [Pimelobacter simplex]|uniref:low temperature requirement protein A n=1 Tax=Nocardioides simplex TaxID=2045 RepID=UPI003AAB2019